MASTSHRPAADLRRPTAIRTLSKQSHSADSNSAIPAITTAVPNRKPSTPLSPTKSETEPRHQRIVLADPVAFGYLEDDKSTTVLTRSRQLEGYQSYIVEQWACSRTHPTFVIAAYTGDSSHTIQVGVLSVPARENAWSPRLKAYFKALTQYHARQRETPLGILMVTNLSGFPSSLTIVLVPQGDVRKHREDFIVNENLKRLGCSGRVGLALSEPTVATQAKFHQIYKTSEKISLYSSVIELVKLCQVALMLFDRLEPDYADGCLCDVTERALNDWWSEIGTELYNVEPNDGILGPTTVAALLGTLMGARNRLQRFGTPVPKDVFDFAATKVAISQFQKATRLHRTRRLDRATIKRLHTATAKQTSGDGWGVSKVVKSTVAELSGKGGEMVMDMVTRRDRKNPTEIETVDIDKFVQLIKGDRAKWLWQGKARPLVTRDLLSDTANDDRVTYKTDGDTEHLTPERKLEPVAHTEAIRKRDAALSHRKHPSQFSVLSDAGTEDHHLRPTVIRRATGRLRDAVGMKGHQYSYSRDSYRDPARNKSFDTLSSVESEDDPATNDAYHGLQTADNTASENEAEAADQRPTFTKTFSDTPVDSRPDLFGPRMSTQRIMQAVTQSSEDVSPSRRASETITSTNKVTSSDVKALQLNSTLLQRTQSFSTYITSKQLTRNENYYPRHLSFSIAEDSMLSKDIFRAAAAAAAAAEPQSSHQRRNPRADHHFELLKAASAKQLSASIAYLSRSAGAWTTSCLETLSALLELIVADAEQLSSLYYPRKEEYASLSAGSREIVGEERARLAEAVKDVETFGAKLEYEIGALRGKVEDVEEAVAEFEQQVDFTERRVAELTKERDRRGWMEIAIGYFGGFSGRQIKDGG